MIEPETRREQRFLNEYAAAITDSGHLTHGKVHEVIGDIIEEPDQEFPDNLGPLVAFVKRGIAEDVSLNLLMGRGLDEVFDTGVSGAVIINDAQKLNRNLLTYMDGNKYIKGSRMLVFHEDKLVLADVSRCNPHELAQKFNPHTILAMLTYLARISSRKDPEKKLISILEQSMGLSDDEFDIVHEVNQGGNKKEAFFKTSL